MSSTSSSSLLIRGGTVYDGTGAAPFRGDVLVEGGRIVAVAGSPGPGSVTARAASRVIHADGLAVCPGFIDIHSHSDLALLHPESAEILGPFVAQGVTTQVIGNCGLGAAPAPAAQRDTLAAFMALITPDRVEWTWSSYADYLDALRNARPPLNVVPLAAHGAIRCAVMGGRPGPARGPDLEAMEEELRGCLGAGAFGLSAGLIYPPGLWADTDELAALCSLVAAAGGLFACHVRGSSETALDAERELLDLARRTGVRVQHSHHEAFGAPYWHLARQTLAMENDARDGGIDVASDVIPYHAVNTTLLAVLPPWTLAGGVGELCRRLDDAETLPRIEREIRDRDGRWPPWEDGWAHNLVRATGWDNIVLLQAASRGHQAWIGHSLAAVAQREGRTAFECAAEILRAAHGNVMARYHGVAGAPGDDEVLGELLRHPEHAIGIDVILKGDGVPHPGGYGAFPRWLGLYARERGLVPLEEAIRKVTSLPADRLGLSDRGRLHAGAAADIVVFDERAIGERATYAEPRRAPTGVHTVVINGAVADGDGRTSAAGRGMVLTA